MPTKTTHFPKMRPNSVVVDPPRNCFVSAKTLYRCLNVSTLLQQANFCLLLCAMLHCVPSSANTPPSTSFSAVSFTDFQCSSSGPYVSNDFWTSSQEMRSRFSHSPAATAKIKSILKQQNAQSNLLAKNHNKNPLSSLFVRQCTCQDDWMSAFCLRANHYNQMNPSQAPTVCICRQRMDDETEGCNQFLARCFPTLHQKASSTLNHRHLEGCSCCINQPDDYCHQLDCRRMHPDFGPQNSTSCVCYNQSHYPHHICAPRPPVAVRLPPPVVSHTPLDWSSKVTPIERVIAVTWRPTPPVANKTSQSLADGGWTLWLLTPHRLALLILIGTVVGTALCLGAIRIVLTRNNTSKRISKEATMSEQQRQESGGYLRQENSEMNRLAAGEGLNHLVPPESAMHFV